MSVLVAYASKHGATQQVAERIAARLSNAGLEVALRPAGDVKDLAGYSAIVLGSGIYAGSWLRPAAAFVDRFAGKLASTPVWAFSCGPVGDPLGPTERPKAADASAAKLGAQENKLFGGVVDRSQLSVLERGIMRATKVPDGDYRNWSDIEAWADQIAAELTGGEAPSLEVDDFWALHTGQAPSTTGGTCSLSVQDLGVLRVLSGQLEACDPYVYLGDGLVTFVPPGDYSVQVTLADVSEEQDGSHIREAYLSVIVDDGETARVELLQPEDRPQPPAGDFYGVSVDSGTVAFVDHVAADDSMPEDRGSWYDELFDSGQPSSWFQIMDSPDQLREGCANIVLPRSRRGENVILSHSGWGDGYYPVYRTLGADGGLLAIHIDLQVAGNLKT